MPGLGQPFETTTEDLDQGAAAAQLPQSDRTAEGFGHFDFFRNVSHEIGNAFLNTIGQDPNDPMDAFGNLRDTDTRLPAEQLNERYGIDGYLRFNEPHTEDEASWMSAQAARKQYHDTVFAKTNADPLMDFGASVAGALTDPAALTVMLATGGIGDAALGAFGVGEAGVEATAIGGLGRLANLGGRLARPLAVGAIDNTPFVAANYGIAQAVGDDYDMGDALRDIAAGAILHTGAHFAFRGAKALLGRYGEPPAAGEAVPDVSEPGPQAPAHEAPSGLNADFDPVPAAGVPKVLDELNTAQRAGAFVKALDDATDDRPVDVGQYVERALQARAPGDLPPAGGLRADLLSTTAPRALDLAAAPEMAARPIAEGDTARAMLADLAGKFARDDAGNLDLRAPGKAAEPIAPAPELRIDLRPMGEAKGEGAPGGDITTNDVAPGAGKLTGDQIVAGDPELKALHEDTQRLSAETGIPLADDAAQPKRAPNTLAELVRSVATCVLGEGLG